jgi:hypothetical protein
LQFCTIKYCSKVSLVKPTVYGCSSGLIQNLLCNFWTSLRVSTNFGSLNYFWELNKLETVLKRLHGVGPHIRPTATVQCGVAAHTLLSPWPKRCGLLGPVLLAWANRQSGPAGLQPSSLRPTAPGAGEPPLPRGHLTRRDAVAWCPMAARWPRRKMSAGVSTVVEWWTC